jgi:hypothetical protein
MNSSNTFQPSFFFGNSMQGAPIVIHTKEEAQRIKIHSTEEEKEEINKLFSEPQRAIMDVNLGKLSTYQQALVIDEEDEEDKTTTNLEKNQTLRPANSQTITEETIEDLVVCSVIIFFADPKS